MKAFTKYKYGGPEVLQLEEVEKPTVKEGHILIKVMANSANPVDWHVLRGEPFLARFSFGLFKPKYKRIGSDFSGIVEEVGNNVSHFKKGDLVFGEALSVGAFAEYICAPARICGIMPKEADFMEMACVPIAGLTALQGLVDSGQIKKGESVLINGASGGVGHFTVQIAKAFGAEVTGVCSTRNAEFVKTLGADNVVAYDKENIHRHNKKYDLIIDNHGNLFHDDFTRMGKRGVLIGFTTIGRMISLVLKNVFSKFSLKPFTAEANTKDLETLAEFILKKEIKVHVSRFYPYNEIPDAIGFIEDMRTKGKIAMSWEQ